MKLSFLIYSYFPYGGQQRDFYAIVRECVSRGHEVVIYAWRWQGEVPAGAELVRVPVNALSRTGLYRKYTKWVAQVLAQAAPDLVIGFSKMPLLDVCFAADPCFAEKAETQRGAYYRFTPRYRHFRQYEQAVFGAGSQTEVLILSPQQRETFTRHYPDCADRLHQVPPGITKDRRVEHRDQELREQFRQEYGLADDEKLLLQIGSGFRVKGVDRSLRALAALPEALLEKTRFMLVGQDKPSRFLRQAARLGIADRVQVLPGRDDIPRFLAGADLLLHPAYLESAGYVLLEATIAGLPVLTTASCGYAFHIEKANSGQVCSEPFEQAELDRRLRDMLENLEGQPWSDNGLAYGLREDLYSMPQAAADLIETIHRRDL